MDGANGARIGATLEELCEKIHLSFDIRNTEGARDYIRRVLIAQLKPLPSLPSLWEARRLRAFGFC
jgi:hypothetical protein